MAEYSFGEIVLVDFPYSDGLRSKFRPALVLETHPDGDILFARISSAPRESPFDITLADWSSSNLMFPSIVRVTKLTTLLSSAVTRKVGKLSRGDREKVISAFCAFVNNLGLAHYN